MANNYLTKGLRRLSILTIALLILTAPSSALVAPSSTPVVKTENEALKRMSLEDFLKLTPKKFQNLTGEKLTIPQKISLKLAQKELKRAIKAKAAIDESVKASAIDTSDFNIGGFILGLLLSIVGVLIAYLIGDTTVIKWAWIGFGISFIIFLLAVLL
jgi:hypothetical protein